MPDSYELQQNYPNPFNPETSIRYGLNADGWVTVKVYNLLGQEIVTLVDAFQSAGFKSVVWDGRDRFGEPVSSGIYLYKMTAGEYTENQENEPAAVTEF